MAKYRFEQIAINSTEKKKPVEEDRFTYLGLEHLDSGSLKVTRFGSEVAPIGENLVLHNGDVLFGKRRAYQKKVAIAPFDGIFSAHGMVLRPREDVIDKSFFPLFISSDYFLDAAIKISVGSLSPTINWRDLKTLEFELPDLATQRKLAETLWSINDTMETYKKLIAATDELVKSQFIERFGKPGTDPFGWGLTTLGECCELNPRKPKDMNTNIDYSFVAMPSVSEDGCIDSSIERPYSEVCKGFTYFGENDVLFAKITPCMENGKGGVAKKLKNGAGFGSTEFHVLRPIKGISDPYWIYILTIFPKFRSDAEKVMTGTGGQRRVPITYLNEYPIALPPIDLQEQFAAFVRQSDKSKLLISRLKEFILMGYRGHGKM